MTSGLFVELDRAELLDGPEANVLAGGPDCRVIILCGPHDAGKTTMLAALYQQFCRADRFGGYRFKRSSTVHALERIAYQARVNSGEDEPQTERTLASQSGKYAELTVVRDAQPEKAVHLLFGDWWGETYRQVRDSAERARNLPGARRADHLVVLLDGGALADPLERQAAVSEARQVLRRLLEAQAIGIQTHVEIVVTKMDLVRRAGKASIDFAELMSKELADEVSAKVASTSIHQVAAISRQPGMEAGFGLPALLRRWVEDHLQFPASELSPIRVTSTRNFDRTATVQLR